MELFFPPPSAHLRTLFVRERLRHPFRTKARKELVGTFIELAQWTLQREEDLPSPAFSACTLQGPLTNPSRCPHAGAPAGPLPCGPLSDPTTEEEAPGGDGNGGIRNAVCSSFPLGIYPGPCAWLPWGQATSPGIFWSSSGARCGARPPRCPPRSWSRGTEPNALRPHCPRRGPGRPGTRARPVT